MNKVILMGRLTREPDKYETSGGKTYVRFDLAVNRLRAGCDFISCVAWEKTASTILHYCHKGTKILVNGHIQVSKYQNKDGDNRVAKDVVVETIEFAESRQNAAEDIQPKDEGFTDVPEEVEEGLPFN